MMLYSHLKRAEQAIEVMRDRGDLSLQLASALQDLIDAIRSVEDRVERTNVAGSPPITPDNDDDVRHLCALLGERHK
jgi:hypothetical protein